MAVSHVLTSALPAGKPDSTETPADYFLSTSESFAKLSRDGSLLKTSRQFSLFQQEEPYSENLPRSGSMRNGELYERPMLALRIGGTGRSSWHTPRANECEEGAETFVKRNGDRGAHCFSGLTDQIVNWPTPRTEDSESCGNHPGAVDSLTGATRQWATPRTITGGGESAERKKELGREESGGGDLQSQVNIWQTPSTDSFRCRGGDRKNEMGLDQQARFANFAATPSAQQQDATAAPIAKEKDWPTLAARDYRGANSESHLDRSSGAKHLDQLPNFVCHSFPQAQPTPTHGDESSPTGPTSRLRLNPNFVDWLMGLPSGWTDYAPVETAWWSFKVRSHLKFLLKGHG